MSEIEIGLRTVLRNIDLSMLVGTHGSGIYVDIRIQLLCGNLKTSRFEKSSE